MRHKARQHGFGVVGILVTVATLAVIGTAGWFTYQHNRVRPTGATAGTQTTNQSDAQQTTDTQTPAVAYLDIKEWGIKLPLTDSIKDAYYVVATNSTDTMWLGLTSLDDKGCGVSLGNQDGASAPIAALVRVSPTEMEPVKGKPYSEVYPGVTIGNYFYGYVSGTNNKTCAPASTLQSIDSAFTSSVKSGVSAMTN